MTTLQTHAEGQSPQAQAASPFTTAAWLVVLTVAGALSTLALACATPFAAFGALAALHMRRAEGTALIILVWATNQVIGFGLLHYPHTAVTYAWGVGLLASALAGMAGAYAIRRVAMPAVAGAVCALAAALVASEVAIYLAGLVLEGTAATFLPKVLFNITWTNAVTLAGILLLHALAGRVGLIGRVPGGSRLSPV